MTKLQVTRMAPYGRWLDVNWPTDESSVIYDIGGYNGYWTLRTAEKHKGRYCIFEPVKRFYDNIMLHISEHENIRAYNYALGCEDKMIKIGILNDSSTVVSRDIINEEFELCVQIDVNTAIKHYDNIRLMAINCEGGEYDILPALIKTGGISKVDFLQVQFHTFVEGYQDKYNEIHDALIQTHDRVYHWPFVWDIWQRKGI